MSCCPAGLLYLGHGAGNFAHCPPSPAGDSLVTCPYRSTTFRDYQERDSLKTSAIFVCLDYQYVCWPEPTF